MRQRQAAGPAVEGISGVVGIPQEVARAIRLVVLDVDGVLTDAGVYLGRSAQGETVELKRFDIQDGLAIKLLAAEGIVPVVVSGRVSAATDVRMLELGVEVHQDPHARKLQVVERLLAEHGVGWEALAMVGDDLPDLPILTRCGLPVAVANAVPEVVRVCRWQTRRSGGAGAVREFIRELLLARGRWEAVVAGYVAEKEGAGA